MGHNFIITLDNDIYFQPSKIWSITPIQFRECGCNHLSYISTVEHHICKPGMFQSFGTPQFPTAKQKNTNINPWWRETTTWKKQHVCYWILTRMGIKWLTQCFSSTKYLIQTSKEARHGEQAGKGKTIFWVASDQKNLLKSPWSTNLLGVLIVDGSSRPYVGLKDLEILDCFSLWETFCLIHSVAHVTICIYQYMFTYQ